MHTHDDEPLTPPCMCFLCIAHCSHPGVPHIAPASCRQQWAPVQQGWEAGSALQALLVLRVAAPTWNSGWLGVLPPPLLLLVRATATSLTGFGRCGAPPLCPSASAEPNGPAELPYFEQGATAWCLVYTLQCPALVDVWWHGFLQRCCSQCVWTDNPPVCACFASRRRSACNPRWLGQQGLPHQEGCFNGAERAAGPGIRLAGCTAGCSGSAVAVLRRSTRTRPHRAYSCA